MLTGKDFLAAMAIYLHYWVDEGYKDRECNVVYPIEIPSDLLTCPLFAGRPEELDRQLTVIFHLGCAHFAQFIVDTVFDGDREKCWKIGEKVFDHAKGDD